MVLLEGKSVVQKKEEELMRLSDELIEKFSRVPKLSILAMNDDLASNSYVNRIKKVCSKFKIEVEYNNFSDESKFLEYAMKVNEDDSVTSIMFQEPLPKKLKAVIEKIDYRKDVEGINSKNLGNLFLNNEEKIVPCTAKAITDILDYYGIVIEGKKIVILGRSNIVGKPLALELIARNGTVTLCHSKTSNVGQETKNADIVVVAIGKPNYLKAENIKVGAFVIDVGINFVDGKIVGDVDFESSKGKVAAITPVPGGVGVVTNYCLVENILKTFKLQNKRK
mgnify:FL=1